MEATMESKTVEECVSSLPEVELNGKTLKERLMNGIHHGYYEVEATSVKEAVLNYLTVMGNRFYLGILEYFQGHPMRGEGDYQEGWELANKTMGMMESPLAAQILVAAGNGITITDNPSKDVVLLTKSEHERLLAVERAYNLLCEETKKDKTTD